MEFRRKDDGAVKEISDKFYMDPSKVIQKALNLYMKTLQYEKDGYKIQAVMQRGYLYRYEDI